MFTFLRSRLRFAGRIGWVDGRRGYPGDEQYVEVILHRSAGAPSEDKSMLTETAGTEAQVATVLPMRTGRQA